MARSLIRDPDIFVLDEATSNLDSHSERLIQDAFSHIRQDHTMLVVAHRLSTVKQADCILVLDHGRLAEEGTHEVLLEKNGIYAHLWYLQSGTISPTDSFTDR
jgi:ABC-type multidrug transport system fused ATPase/permease subunit